MEEIFLSLHSWLRWVVLGLGIYALYTNYRGWKFKLLYGGFYKRLNSWFIASLHTQLILGLIIYFGTSTMMKNILADFGASMKLSETRFWSVEHIMGMVIGIAIAQVGNIKAKSAADDAQSYKTAFIWFSVALLIIALMIPFGIWNVERPLFRI